MGALQIFYMMMMMMCTKQDAVSHVETEPVSDAGCETFRPLLASSTSSSPELTAAEAGCGGSSSLLSTSTSTSDYRQVAPNTCEHSHADDHYVSTAYRPRPVRVGLLEQQPDASAVPLAVLDSHSNDCQSLPSLYQCDQDPTCDVKTQRLVESTL